MSGVLQWVRKNLVTTLIYAAVGGGIGWLVNIYIMAEIFDGFRVGPGVPATGEGSRTHGFLFWTFGSALVFALFGYWRTVGTSQFVKAILGIPKSLGVMVTQDGRAAWGHLLGGAAISFFGSLLISPWISGLLTVGLFAAVPSMIGRMLASSLNLVYRAVAGRLLPKRRQLGDTSLSMAVSLIGVASALAMTFFIDNTVVKILLGLLCIAGAFFLSRSGAPPSRPSLTLMALGAMLAFSMLSVLPVLADDGGKRENGGTWISWIRSGQAGSVIGLGSLGALGAGLGSAGGGALGGVMGSFSGAPQSSTKRGGRRRRSGSAQPAPPPPVAAPGPAMVTDTRVVSGKEAIDELVKAGAKRDPAHPGCVQESSLPGMGGPISGIAYHPKGGTVCPDDVALITEWVHPAEPPVEQWLGGKERASEAPDTDRLIEDMGKVGLKPTVVTDVDGNRHVQMPKNLPDHIRDVAHTSKIAKVNVAGEVQDVEVVGSSVWVSHWPSTTPQAPTKAPAPMPANGGGATGQAATGPSLPEAGSGEVQSAAKGGDEGTVPAGEAQGIRAEGSPQALAKGDAGAADDSSDAQEAVLPMPVPPPTPKPEARADGLPGVDPDKVRRGLGKFLEQYNKMGLITQMAVDELLDQLEVPPEMRPPVDPSSLTDEQIREAISKIDPKTVPDKIGLVSTFVNGLGKGVLGPERAREVLDGLNGLQRTLGQRQVDATPEGIEREVGTAPQAGTAPTIDHDTAVNNVANAYDRYIPESRLNELWNSRAVEYPDAEFNAGYRVFAGPDDKHAGHTTGFVLRAPGEQPHVALREGSAGGGTIQHETLHLASNPAFRGSFGGNLNEAATEYMTRRFTEPAGIDRSNIAYHSQGGTEVIEEMVKLVGEEKVHAAYFGDGPEAVEELQQSLDAARGPGTFDLIKRMTNHKYPDYPLATQVLQGTFPRSGG
jgi:hypothetical protein